MGGENIIEVIKDHRDRIKQDTKDQGSLIPHMPVIAY